MNSMTELAGRELCPPHRPLNYAGSARRRKRRSYNTYRQFVVETIQLDNKSIISHRHRITVKQMLQSLLYHQNSTKKTHFTKAQNKQYKSSIVPINLLNPLARYIGLAPLCRYPVGSTFRAGSTCLSTCQL